MTRRQRPTSGYPRHAIERMLLRRLVDNPRVLARRLRSIDRGFFSATVRGVLFDLVRSHSRKHRAPVSRKVLLTKIAKCPASVLVPRRAGQAPTDLKKRVAAARALAKSEVVEIFKLTRLEPYDVLVEQIDRDHRTDALLEVALTIAQNAKDGDVEAAEGVVVEYVKGLRNRDDHGLGISASGSAIPELVQNLEAQLRGERNTIPLPWRRLSRLSACLRPGTVAILAGGPGVGKSHMALDTCLYAGKRGHDWIYLPLEESKEQWVCRLLAKLERDYTMTKDDAITAKRRLEAVERNEKRLRELERHICESPRKPQKDEKGNPFVPSVPPASVLRWLARAVKKYRLIVIDPFAMIDFTDSRELWKAQDAFISQVVGLAAYSSATVLIVAHPKKRNEKAEPELAVDQLQGSAGLGRNCQCCLILQSHAKKSSRVYRVGGTTEEVQHNCTVGIAKARFGQGARQRIAFQHRSDSPVFEELGVIAPRGAIGGSP